MIKANVRVREFKTPVETLTVGGMDVCKNILMVSISPVASERSSLFS